MVDNLNETDEFIDSSEHVMNLVNGKGGLQVSSRETLAVLKQMGMRYRKVKHVPLKANSERNLVLRQKFT